MTAEQSQITAGVDIPNPGGIVVGAAEQLPAIGGIGDAQYRVTMTAKLFSNWPVREFQTWM